MPAVDDVAVGDRIPERRETLDQARLIQYAGASGDFNPLHWQEEFASQVSPTGGVIAHGMLNMGLVSATVTAWAGGPEHVLSLTASFRKPCPVGATVVFGGEVVEVDAGAGTARLQVWAELEDGTPVVDRRRSSALVRLA
jgi:acyl dehydratase